MTASDHDAGQWKAVLCFATAPESPHRVASQTASLLDFEQFSINDEGDVEIVLHVEGTDAFDAARRALDRVQSATAETEFVAPELLEVDVLCLYGGVDPDAR